MKHFSLLVQGRLLLILPLCLLFRTSWCQQLPEQVELARLNVSAIRQEVLVPFVNSSMTGESMKIQGKEYSTGISVHAPSAGSLYLGGKGLRFRAMVGVDDRKNRKLNAPNMESLVATDGTKTFFYVTELNQPRRLIGVAHSIDNIAPGSVEFTISGDGRKLWSSGIVRQGEPARVVDVDVKGVQLLSFTVSDAGDGNSGDIADWCDARVEVSKGAIVQIVPADYLLTRAGNDDHFKKVLEPALQQLPAYAYQVAAGDWLLEKPSIKAAVFSKGDKELVMSNGLVSRTFHISPNAATVSLKNLVTGEEYLRAVKPEATVMIDSVDYAIGGLDGQVDKGYLLPEWLDRMYSIPNAFTLDHFGIQALKERFPSAHKRWMPATQWAASGRELVFYYRHDKMKEVQVEVHYGLYDGIPLFSKWIVVRNSGVRKIRVDHFAGEIIAHHEADNLVAVTNNWKRPNLYMENDFAFGGFTYEEALQSISWEPDPAYTSQGNYAMLMPCVLKSQPAKGPGVSLENGAVFESFRTFVMPLDGTDRERNSLSQRKMYRLLAPWSTENPIFLHLTSIQPDVFKTAVDQCVQTGYEMIILSFGSGLNMENQTPEDLQRYRAMADYAHSKGIELGGYSLLSSRRISDSVDVIDVKTGKPGGAMFGNAPCLGSGWGIDYFRQLTNFYEKTGFDLLEHDGSYPGDFCASTLHPGHEGYADSQWKQWKQITAFYQWLRSRDIYSNVPDFYFLSGSNKTSIGYREVNWSLPRDQQLVLGRQNIYDGTWMRTPSMGWTFVPLVQYHGGGDAATLEPLSKHLVTYEAHMEQNYGAGVQACYRGTRLYDTDSTRLLVQREIAHYKKYRDILNADIIHLRRPTGRDWDGILHADPALPEKGYALLFNPSARDTTVEIDLPLYYTGLRGSAQISIEERTAATVKIDANGHARFPVRIPAEGNTWIVIRAANEKIK